MKECGMEIWKRVMVFSNGLMVQDMKVIGNKIKQMEKENFFI